MTTADLEPRDRPIVLRFSGWPGWTLFGSFVLVHAVIALLAGGPAMHDGRGTLTLALLSGAALLVVLPGHDRLELWRVFTILAVITLCTLLMLEQLLITGPSGFLNWNYNASNFILFAVALRGRIRWAWIGLGIIAAITLTWSVLATGTVVQGLYLIYGEIGALLAGSFFALVLRRAADGVRTLQRIRRQRVGEEHLLAETERERAAELVRMRQRVTPVLTAIAGGRVTTAQRQEHRLLEAALRDEIRGARLAAEPLASAVRAARSRGVDVVLLDDADEVALGWADLEWAAEILADIDRDAVTVRLSANPALLTVTTADGTVVHRKIDPN